jgi:U3 small nucleolar RNA-associated protein 20
VQIEHRPGLLPLLVRVLFPRMRKRSGRLGGRGAPGSARAAILNFLAGAEPSELAPLLELLLAPLSVAFRRLEDELEENDGDDRTRPAEELPVEQRRLFEPTWWARRLGRRDGAYWAAVIDGATMAAQPLRRQIGYLNTLEDLLGHLGHNVSAYLPELLTLVVCLLESATADATWQDEGHRELRSTGLRLVALALARFPAATEYAFLWQRLLGAMAPLLARSPTEGASSDRAPPFVELVAALAASSSLAPILADCNALEDMDAVMAPVGLALIPCNEPWARDEQLGSRILGHCVAALSSKHCHQATVDAVLGILEAAAELPGPLPFALLDRHTAAILAGLQAVVVASWQDTSATGTGAAPKRGPPGSVKRQRQQGMAAKRVAAARALCLLEAAGARVASWVEGRRLTEALSPLLRPRPGRDRGPGAERMPGRALAVLASVWNRLADAEGAGEPRPAEADTALQGACSSMGALAGALSTRAAIQALVEAFAAASRLLPDATLAADLLAGLSAMSAAELDEPDYDARMAAYSRLKPDVWAGATPLSLPPLLHTCLRDLKNGDDLALRHAAAQGLARFVTAAEAEAGFAAVDPNNSISIDDSANGRDTLAPGVLTSAARRVLFPQLTRGLASPSLAVRQEHLALLRMLGLAAPDRFQEVAALTDAEPEADFLLNVGHLQLHRRAR